MLIITLISLILAIPLSSAGISACLYTRIVAISLAFGGALSYNCFPSSLNLSTNANALLLDGHVHVQEESTDAALSCTMDAMDAGVGLYSGMLHITSVTIAFSTFLLLAGATILSAINVSTTANASASVAPTGIALKSVESTTASATIGGVYIIREAPMIILFTVMGASFLVASADLVSMYLSIELQSFGVYILASLYRDSESATAAGLKYFLLGALSSAFILLGSALVYAYTGLTNLDSIFELIAVIANSATFTHVSDTTAQASVADVAPLLGFVIISVGLFFKVAAAPFHSWAPDVYDGTPTIVTTWLTVIPKISIFIFLLELYVGITAHITPAGGATALASISAIDFPLQYGENAVQILLLICAFLSLVIGTVVGLRQYRIKRVLAYSTISHVGFLLLALSIISANAAAGEESLEAFLFYILQYTATNIDAFFVLLAFGYIRWGKKGGNANATVAPSSNYALYKIDIQSYKNGDDGKSGITQYSTDINFTHELQGQFRANPVLGASFAVCLFSMAGVPPIVGFFAKYTILYSAIHNGYIFIAIIAILASVVSAVYYLRIIRVIHFSDPLQFSANGQSNDSTTASAVLSKIAQNTLTSVHSYTISVLTLFIMLFALNPTLILNSTGLMALSMYVT